MSEKWINNCGKILLSKGNKIYMQFDKDFEVKKGDTIFLTKYADHLEGLVRAGHMTEDEVNNELEKKGFIKYIASKPPRKKDS